MKPNDSSCRFLSSALRVLLTIFLGVLLPEVAFAERLEYGVEAPAWKRLGAQALLVLHIGGGTVGLLAGVVATTTRKGGARHRLAGRAFAASMSITYLIGAGVAPFLVEGRRTNFVAGVLALYLLVTGVSAAKRRRFRAGWPERVGFGIALAITTAGIAFIIMGSRSASGTVDGSPPQAFAIFVISGFAATVGEGMALVRATLSEKQRMARHLWRMHTAFFIGSGSLFLGQPQLFPDAFNATPLPALLAFAPILSMLFSLVALRGKGGGGIARAPEAQ